MAKKMHGDEEELTSRILFSDGPMAGKTVREMLMTVLSKQIDMATDLPGPPPMPKEDGWKANDYAYAYVHGAFLSVILHEQAGRWLQFLEEIQGNFTPETIEGLGQDLVETMALIQTFVEYKAAKERGDKEEEKQSKSNLDDMTGRAMAELLLRAESSRKRKDN